MRRKTTTEKRARGTDRADRERDAQGTYGAEIMPPGYLSKEALAIWRKKAPALRDEGLLTNLDIESFALWCHMQAELERMMRSGEVPGRDFLAHYRPLSNQFGLNPDARNKMGMPRPGKPDPKKSPWDEF